MSVASAKQAQRPVTNQQIMVARQPIYNDRMGVFGYELLFRSPEGNSNGPNLTKATAQVLASTVLDYRLDKFVHNRKAVINVTRAFIEVIQDVQLPPEQVILDLPTNMAANEKLITKLKDIKRLGYGLSISGLANLKQPQLLSLADIFQIDVQKMNVDILDKVIKHLRRYQGLSLQALKIETLEECQSYRKKGFQYFQGYFLGRPRVYVSRSLSGNRLAILQLLATIHNMDTPIEELEEQITRDVSLSYKLLKLVNAPFFGVPQEVDSIKRAIVLLGRDEIRKWISLLALGGMSDEPVALMEISILRARICQLLAEKAGLPKDSYFTVGMFSALDLLMKQPIEHILAQLPLSEAVKSAILDGEGVMGNALVCAKAIENAQWEKMRFAELDQNELTEVYHQSVEWAGEVMKQF